jgi:hypothetical protein
MQLNQLDASILHPSGEEIDFHLCDPEVLSLSWFKKS